MKYYSAIKKNEILPFATAEMDLKGIMLSEISQRKTNAIWFHLYVESKKQNKQTVTNLDTKNKLMVTRWEVGEGCLITMLYTSRI